MYGRESEKDNDLLFNNDESCALEAGKPDMYR